MHAIIALLDAAEDDIDNNRYERAQALSAVAQARLQITIADAETAYRNSAKIYALLDKAQRQIDELIVRLDALEAKVNRPGHFANEGGADSYGNY